MGHTFVARFSDQDIRLIRTMMQKAGVGQTVKIPYGRPCDRAAADLILPYHMTLFHWGRQEDAYYLGNLEKYRFPGACKVTVTEVVSVNAEEGSKLVKLRVKPSAGFAKMTGSLEQLLHHRVSSDLHITLAVSKDHSKMGQIEASIKDHMQFPFEMTVTGISLYHIWEPVRLVRTFG